MAIFAPRYANAFAAVAASRGLDVAAAQGQMRDFAATYAGSPELQQILSDPSVQKVQKLKVIDAIAAKIGMMSEVRNFIAILMDHDHLAALDEVLAAYDEVADEAVNVTEAEVTSSRVLAAEDRAGLEAQVAKLAGGKVRVTYLEDASLLGGAVVKIGSTVYDGSVKAQLAQLKQRLVSAQ